MSKRGSGLNNLALGLYLGFLSFAFAAAAVNGSPDNPPVQSAPSTKQFTISDNVDLVLLDVRVKDKAGSSYITDLAQSNFQVFEDGHERRITQFGRVDTPVTVGLIVDNSGSMRLKRPEVILAGLAFARESNRKDEFFVLNFNNSVLRGLPDRMLFTDDLQSLRSALYFGQPVGQTALYDAIAYGLKHLEFSHHEKRTLVVVSDGGDNVSKTTLVELIKLIPASRATIYTIGLYDPDDPSLNRSVLRRFATSTGGSYYEPSTLDSIVSVFDEISRSIRNSYTIGFVPDELNKKHTVRSIKVVAQAGGKKLDVHARSSFSTATLPGVGAMSQSFARSTEGKGR